MESNDDIVMYIHIHIHTYVHTYILVHTYIYTYIHIHTPTYVIQNPVTGLLNYQCVWSSGLLPVQWDQSANSCHALDHITSDFTWTSGPILYAPKLLEDQYKWQRGPRHKMLGIGAEFLWQGSSTITATGPQRKHICCWKCSAGLCARAL
jgi:hypothetical protein